MGLAAAAVALDNGSLGYTSAPAGAAPSGKPAAGAEVDADVVPAAAPRATLWWAAANWTTWLLHRALALLSRPQTTIYLKGSYAPVTEELHARDLEVVAGALPPGLEGAYVRVGPNPALKPVAGYHWFDGDGMAHAVRIKGGKASYSNRFVETSRRALERQAGYAAIGKIGDMRGVFGLVTLGIDALKKRLGVVDAAQGLGTANTALAAHAGRLLALNEGDLPYALRLACDGLVETLGRLRCGGALAHPITAHPKTCPRTGELFAFGYSPAAAPFLHFTRFAADGAVAADFPVPIPAGAMIHDCAITDQHMVFVVPPLLFKPEAMVKTGKLPFVFDKSEPLRIGVMDRNADDASGVRWFELPSLMCFHTANAWVDADGRVELHLCTFREFCLDSFTAVSEDAEPYLSRAVLDLRSGAATVERLSPLAGDFPTVPASLVGRKTRYAYVATFKTGAEGAPLFYGVAKIDLAARGEEAALVGLARHGAGRVGGEAVFVPRPGGVAEDDGYLATFVVEEATGDSQLVLYDAKTMASAPVVAVRMPQTIPHGFHGLWVEEGMIG